MQSSQTDNETALGFSARTPEANETSNLGNDVIESDWVAIVCSKSSAMVAKETLKDRIVRIPLDLVDINKFYKFQTSPARYERLRGFFKQELEALSLEWSSSLSQEEKADYLLLHAFLKRAQKNLELEISRDHEIKPFFDSFCVYILPFLEARQRVETLHPQSLARELSQAASAASMARKQVEENPKLLSRTAGLHAVKAVELIHAQLQEAVEFYKSYDPMFDWWVVEPATRLAASLVDLVPVLRRNILGIVPGQEETIVGEPVGREGLLVELEAEMIAYTPEELINIAHKEYEWCAAEMKAASRALGHGDSWRVALEYVKDLYEPPGAHTVFIRKLVDEGAAYVVKHDLVTVPPLAAETMRMHMIPPAEQKVSPFFMGGTSMYVSYPTAEVKHEDKLMAMRGNNRHFSKATAFHEMIPGHHLQMWMADRVRPYRQLFRTPFCTEGWAMYWEMVLWERGDFFTSPEDRIGTLFWRMHRCARIIFSLKFHMGQMTAQECVDLLVDWVGHERSTAEGEVRRSLNGEWSPLYQAGYMLGALQLMGLRKEVLGQRRMGEKELNNRILREGEMPIAMMRAIILEQELSKDWKTEWRFYEPRHL